MRTPSARRSPARRASTGWYAGAKMKQHPAARRHRCTPSGSRSIFTPNRSSTSAAPTRPLTARLPCLATGTPAAAATSAAPVEMLKVPAPSPPVPAVSSTLPPSRSSARARARIARAPPVSSAADSPLSLQRDQEARDQRLGRLAVEDLAHHALGRWRRRASGRRAPRQTRRAIRSRARPALENSRAAVCRRACRSIRDGTGCPRPGACDAASPITSPSAVRALTSRHDGNGVGVDEQRMIAHRVERVRQAGEDVPAVVHDRRGLAVHQAAARALPCRRRPRRYIDGPGKRRGSAARPPSRAAAGRDTPASLGVHGPGEITIACGAIARTPATSIASLRRDFTSAPSSPRYCTRL